MTDPAILYKYYPADLGCAALDKQLVHFSHPDRFNDPFELQPHTTDHMMLDGYGPKEELDAVRADGIRRAFANLMQHDDRAGASHQDEAGASPRAWFGEWIRKSEILEWKKNVVVFSATEDRDSLLMWAHYANAHTGLVIGFGISRQSFAFRKDGISRSLGKVRYSTHRPSARTLRDLSREEILLTKSAEWMHEKEWRMFESPSNADGDPPVSDCWPFRIEADVVREVIVGARATAADSNRVATLLAEDRYRHVHLFRSEIDEQQFRLNMVRQ